MRREELQAVQAPLKQRYRENPDAGVVTLRAEGELDSAALSCSVQTGGAMLEAGLHPARVATSSSIVMIRLVCASTWTTRASHALFPASPTLA